MEVLGRQILIQHKEELSQIPSYLVIKLAALRENELHITCGMQT